MTSLILRKLIKSLVLEEGRLREAEISGDRTVQWGSNDHIDDLEKRCIDTAYWRNKYPRGSAKRSHYQTVLSHIKNELKSAHKTNQAINEKDNV